MDKKAVKVWNHNGEQRKCVVASTYAELKEKCSEKLKIDIENLTLKMMDETDIDDDDVFCILESGVTIFALDLDQKINVTASQSTGNIQPTTSEPTSQQTENVEVPECSPALKTWPKTYELPTGKFSSRLLSVLSSGKTIDWSQKHELLSALADHICQYTLYPSQFQRDEVALSLVTKYPQLKETIGSGFSGWSFKLNDKMKNVRRNAESPIIRANKKSAAPSNSHISAKKPKKGEINFAIDRPAGEDDVSINQHINWLKLESKKPKRNQDASAIATKMSLTFSHRRTMINSNASCETIKKEFPILFNCDQLFSEFRRLMEFDLNRTFFIRMENLAEKVVNCARMKNVAPGSKITVILEEYEASEKMKNDEIVAALRVLPYLMKENVSKVYLEYDSIEDISQDIITPTVVVIGNPHTSNEIFVYSENLCMLECPDFVYGITSCFCMYYCLNMQYPKLAVSVFTFIQKIILEINDGLKGNRKLLTFMSTLESNRD